MPLQSKSCAIWVLTECVFPRVLLCRPVFDFATQPITGIEVPTNQPLCVFLIVLPVWYPELVPSFRSKVSFISFWIASFQFMVDTQKDSGRKKTDSTWMKLNLGLICFQPWHWVTELLHGTEKQTYFPQDLFLHPNVMFLKTMVYALGQDPGSEGHKSGGCDYKEMFGAHCEKHKRRGQSVKFTEKVEPVRSGEPRRSSGSQSSVRSCSGE